MAGVRPRARCSRSLRRWRRARCGAEAPRPQHRPAHPATRPSPPAPGPALRLFPPLPPPSPCLRASPSARVPWAPRRPPEQEEEEQQSGVFPSEPPRRGNAAPRSSRVGRACSPPRPEASAWAWAQPEHGLRGAGAARACVSERGSARGSAPRPPPKGPGAPAVPAAGPLVRRVCPGLPCLVFFCACRERSVQQLIIKGVAVHIVLCFGFGCLSLRFSLPL